MQPHGHINPGSVDVAWSIRRSWVSNQAACTSIDSSHRWLTSCIPLAINSTHLGDAELPHPGAHANCIQKPMYPFIVLCSLDCVCPPSWTKQTAPWTMIIILAMPGPHVTACGCNPRSLYFTVTTPLMPFTRTCHCTDDGVPRCR